MNIFIASYITALTLGVTQIANVVADRKYGQKPARFIWVRFLTGFLMLMVSIVFVSNTEGYLSYRISTHQVWVTIWCSFGTSIAAIFFNYLFAGSIENLKVYPQWRPIHWTAWRLLLNYGSWMVYLAGYELLLRGFLFSISLRSVEASTAIVINLFFYSLAHLHKGQREVLASIPFGLLLCLLTLLTENVWTPFIVHTALAVSNDVFAIKAHSKMKINNPN